MSGKYFMPLWTDAYLGDTMHLSTVEHGAYLLLLMAMWRAGGRLEHNDERLARIAGLTIGKWRKIAPTVIGLMEIEDGHVTQKRLQIELKKSTDLAQKRILRAKAGAEAKWLKHKETGLLEASP